jgi:hypothetical protein
MASEISDASSEFSDRIPGLSDAARRIVADMSDIDPWTPLALVTQQIVERLARRRRPTARSINPAEAGETNCEFLPALPTPEKEAPGKSSGEHAREYADRLAGREFPSAAFADGGENEKERAS